MTTVEPDPAAATVSADRQTGAKETVSDRQLFIGYSLLFLGVAFFVLVAADFGLWILGLILVPSGLVIVLKRARECGALAHVVNALAALVVLAIIPAAITYSLIKKSATDIAGSDYCLYQERETLGPPVLTRSVLGLSFADMLGRKSRRFGPAHAALITKDRLWLWSFKRARFVPWQLVTMEQGIPAFEGRPTLGRPSSAQVKKCFNELLSSSS